MTRQRKSQDQRLHQEVNVRYGPEPVVSIAAGITRRSHLLVAAIALGIPGCVPWGANVRNLAPSVTPSNGNARQSQLQNRPVAPASAAKDNSTNAPMAMARLLEKRAQTQRAEQIYESMIERGRQGPLPHHRLAVIAAKENRFADANRHFDAALQLSPRSAELLSDFGYALYLQDRLADAERALRIAVQINPSHAAASNNLGLVLGMQGRHDESLTAFKRAVGTAEAHANLAYVRTQQGDLELAKRGYLYALTMDKGLHSAAEALLQIERQLQSQAWLAAAVERDPSRFASSVEFETQPEGQEIDARIPPRQHGLKTSSQYAAASLPANEDPHGPSEAATVSYETTQTPRLMKGRGPSGSGRSVVSGPGPVQGIRLPAVD